MSREETMLELAAWQREITVQGRGSECGRRRAREIRGVASLELENMNLAVEEMTASSYSYPFLQVRIVHVLKRAVVSIQLRSADFELLSNELVHKRKEGTLTVGAKGTVRTIEELTNGSDEHCGV